MQDYQGTVFALQSIDTDIYSVPLNFKGERSASFHVVITGSPVGILKLQISNQLVDLPSDITEWVDYEGSVLDILAAEQIMYDLPDTTIKWFRLVYEAISGSGAISASFYSSGKIHA